MKDFKLTKAQEEILRTQVIDANRPGPILRDFQALLGFVGPDGLKAAGKYNLLPIDRIEEMNRLLSRPLRLKLKRPQLRSHPYLQGLHLLLRASGLSRVEGSGEKARLVLDPAALDTWNDLNPTDQYFTLLEAWLRFGRPEMVGEKDSLFTNFLGDCLQSWRGIPARGQKFDGKPGREVYLRGIGRDMYHVALLDLFGLMEVEQPRSAATPWRPAAVKHRPFGDAVLTLLGGSIFSTWTEDLEEKTESTTALCFGGWQPFFQPYFPEWRDNLVLPEAEPRDGVFVFRASLGRIWRRIAIPAGDTLGDLVSCILRSVHFDNEHLYEFSYRDRFGAMVRVHHPFIEEGGPWVDEVHIGDLPLAVGQSMNLLYDFGDSWRFTVKLERIDPVKARSKKPRVLESHGKAPRQYGRGDEEE